jgi:hypothetical protein
MNSNDEYVNQITLKYLTSIDYKDDVQVFNDTDNKGDKINKSKQTGTKIYRQKDKKFYKKRILNIIKLLLNDGTDITGDDNTNKPNYPLFPDIKNSFDIFIKTCINYLKSQDKCDIIQSDYNDLNIGNVTTNLETKNHDITNNNEINALMMRKIMKKKNSIDSFVKRTSTQQTTTIIPQKKKINLQDPELKTKGLSGVGVGIGSLAKSSKIDTPLQKDKKICGNKNNDIYKETINKLETSFKNDNQEIPNKKTTKKNSKETQAQKGTKSTPNTNE